MAQDIVDPRLTPPDNFPFRIGDQVNHVKEPPNIVGTIVAYASNGLSCMVQWHDDGNDDVQIPCPDVGAVGSFTWTNKIHPVCS